MRIHTKYIFGYPDNNNKKKNTLKKFMPAILSAYFTIQCTYNNIYVYYICRLYSPSIKS